MTPNGQQGSAPAIRLAGVSKTFGRGPDQVEALRRIDLEVERGQVFGFLGPNGAGKSTTIRILMGLLRPTAGSASIFGQTAAPNAQVLTRAGALIEGATFYSFLTGRDNLQVLADTAGMGAERIEMLLDQVGLTNRAGRNVSGYSTGMKQRLGLAAALLSDPDLVILDEPTNGLDPAGIQDMRAFIRSLATEQGKTVFLSSHILHEVEQVCDHVAIIHRGAVIRQGPIAQLLSETKGMLRVLATPVDRAQAALADHWPVQQDGDWLQVQAGSDQAPQLVRALVDANVDVHQLTEDRSSLEDFFLRVTNGEGEDAPAQG
ncbi:MAG: ABC transporter ATP-binding protein [Anaerolineales bacterium]